MPAGRTPVDGLASSLRLAGTGTQEPLWDRLGELTMPVLVVSGGLDERFTGAAHRLSDAIGDERDAPRHRRRGHTRATSSGPGVLRGSCGEWLGQGT